MENFLNFLQENWVEILSTAGTIALILAKTKGTVDPKTAQKRKIKKAEAKVDKYITKAKAQTEKIIKLKENENANSNN